jgi:hypothetical protein
MDTTLWQLPATAPVPENKPPGPPLPGKDAEQVAELTLAALDEKGYCLWKCSALGGDVIMIVDDSTVAGALAGAPAGYPVYTLAELEMTDPLRTSTIRLIHIAKKNGGAVVTGFCKTKKKEARN